MCTQTKGTFGFCLKIRWQYLHNIQSYLVFFFPIVTSLYLTVGKLISFKFAKLLTIGWFNMTASSMVDLPYSSDLMKSCTLPYLSTSAMAGWVPGKPNSSTARFRKTLFQNPVFLRVCNI